MVAIFCRSFTNNIWLLGHTPLIRINSLSDALGVEILGKAEVGYVLTIMHVMDSGTHWGSVVLKPGRKCERPCCIAK